MSKHVPIGLQYHISKWCAELKWKISYAHRTNIYAGITDNNTCCLFCYFAGSFWVNIFLSRSTQITFCPENSACNGKFYFIVLPFKKKILFTIQRENAGERFEQFNKSRNRAKQEMVKKAKPEISATVLDL